MTRRTDAPRPQRLRPQGPIALASRPGRSTGARLKGVYTIPPNDFIYIGNSRTLPPWSIEMGSRFMTWGVKWMGTDSTFDVFAGYYRGVTLWGIDEDGAPYPIDKAGMETRNINGYGPPCYGGVLGAERLGVCEMICTGSDTIIRYLQWGPFPAPYIVRVPHFGLQSFRIEGDNIVEGEPYYFTFMTYDKPVGTQHVTGGIFPIPPTISYDLPYDFIWEIQSPYIVGLTLNSALLIAAAAKEAESGLSNWLAVWAFDPFNIEGTMVDPDAPEVARQPDVMHSVASLGLLPNWQGFYGDRRTDGEAVLVFASSSIDGSSSQVNVIRMSASGAILSNVVGAPAVTQSYASTVFPEYMGLDILHSGDLRVDDDGWSLLESSVPNRSSFTFRYFRSVTRPWGADRYYFVRQVDSANPDELIFTIKDLATDELVGRVTSYADVDTEVAAMNQILAGGYAGVVGENLLASWRYPNISTHNQVVTIELGGFRSAATLAVLAEATRSNRLPEGRP